MRRQGICPVKLRNIAKESLMLVREGQYLTFYSKSNMCFVGTDGRLHFFLMKNRLDSKFLPLLTCRERLGSSSYTQLLLLWPGRSLESMVHPFFVTEQDKDRGSLPWEYHQGITPELWFILPVLLTVSVYQAFPCSCISPLLHESLLPVSGSGGSWHWYKEVEAYLRAWIREAGDSFCPAPEILQHHFRN